MPAGNTNILKEYRDRYESIVVDANRYLDRYEDINTYIDKNPNIDDITEDYEFIQDCIDDANKWVFEMRLVLRTNQQKNEAHYLGLIDHMELLLQRLRSLADDLKDFINY